jgi:Imelysin
VSSVVCRLSAVALLLTLIGCSDDHPAPAVPTAPPPSTVDGTFIPGALEMLLDRAEASFQQFAGAAATLADEFVTCPADAIVATDAWRAARLSWDAASVYRWGPGKDPNVAPSIDYWPVDPEAVTQASTGSEPMTQTEYDSLGSAARGLPAIEVLLFATGPMSDRECSYARLAAASATTTARRVAQEFTSQRATLTAGDPALVTALSALADGVYEVCDMQLGIPSGNSVVAAAADPSLVRQGSGLMAIADVKAQMAEVEGAFDVAIQPIIAARYVGANNPLSELFRQFDTALEPVGNDLATAIAEKPNDVGNATNLCRGIRRGFSTNVSGLLGVTLTLPIGDGD